MKTNEEIIQEKMRAGLTREQAEVVVAADEKSRRDSIRFEASLIPNYLAEAKRSVERAQKHLAEVESMCEKKLTALKEFEALEAQEAQAALSEKEKAQIIEDAEGREAELIAVDAAEANPVEVVPVEEVPVEEVPVEVAPVEEVPADAAPKGKKAKKGE